MALIIICGYGWPGQVPAWTGCVMATAEEHAMLGMTTAGGHARLALGTSGVIWGAKHVKRERQEYLTDLVLTRKLYIITNGRGRGNNWFGHDAWDRRLSADLTMF